MTVFDRGRDQQTEQLRDFIAAHRWTFAKTMPEHPHEYTVRKDARDQGEFDQVVQYIREAGSQEYFGRAVYTYLTVDGWKYWTQGAPIAATILVNRARV